MESMVRTSCRHSAHRRGHLTPRFILHYTLFSLRPQNRSIPTSVLGMWDLWKALMEWYEGASETPRISAASPSHVVAGL
jgi:hypothetical protein